MRQPCGWLAALTRLRSDGVGHSAGVLGSLVCLSGKGWLACYRSPWFEVDASYLLLISIRSYGMARTLAQKKRRKDDVGDRVDRLEPPSIFSTRRNRQGTGYRWGRRRHLSIRTRRKLPVKLTHHGRRVSPPMHHRVWRPSTFLQILKSAVNLCIGSAELSCNVVPNASPANSFAARQWCAHAALALL